MKKNRISNEIPSKYVPLCPIDNMQALVQIMAWHRPGVKPLSEPMLTQVHLGLYAAQGMGGGGVNIISDSALVPSGNRSLLEPRFTSGQWVDLRIALFGICVFDASAKWNGGIIFPTASCLIDLNVLLHVYFIFGNCRYCCNRNKILFCFFIYFFPDGVGYLGMVLTHIILDLVGKDPSESSNRRAYFKNWHI